MSAEAATAVRSEDPITEAIPEFLDVREIYFRTIKQGDELWGSFDFKDEANATPSLSISPINGVTVEFGPILRDGTTGEDYVNLLQLPRTSRPECTSFTTRTTSASGQVTMSSKA